MKNPNGRAVTLETTRIPLDVPLCVDLDGTLTKTDTLVESVLLLLRRRPLLLLSLLSWMLRGKVYFKHAVSSRIRLVADELPYTEDFLAYVQREQAGGRPVWLVTAAHQEAAKIIAEHFGFFTGVIATQETNLAGVAKAQRLVQQFGDRRFLYAGNERQDLAVWRHAAGAIVVNATPALEQQVPRVAPVLAVFGRRQLTVWLVFRIVRAHQWIKNLLLLVPLVASHQLLVPDKLVAVLLGIGSFSAVASAVYIMNDLLDLSADRRHASKRYRPFASADVLPHIGVLLVPLLLAVGVLLAWFTPFVFWRWLVLYFGITTLYSWWLKRIVLIDVITLAILYTVRIFAGGAAATVTVSTWLFVFSLFFFMSLALVKRFVELRQLGDAKDRMPGRGYQAADTALVGQFGVISGYLSILVLALYLSSSEIATLYRQPEWLWLLVPLFLYWLSRVWLLAVRGKVDDDPIVFAIRDRTSYIVGAVALLVVFVAT